MDDLLVKLAAGKLFTHVLGSDECGLGSWAGPLCTTAVVVPREWSLAGVTDSKKLTPAKREALYLPLIESLQSVGGVYYCVNVSSEYIDQVGVKTALREAHERAIAGARRQFHKLHPDAVEPMSIIDGVNAVSGSIPLPKADNLIAAVSAASIIAKVQHDREMYEIDSRYPQYGFKTGSGYGTAKHKEALRQYGMTPYHRKSYAPMKDMKDMIK